MKVLSCGQIAQYKNKQYTDLYYNNPYENEKY